MAIYFLAQTIVGSEVGFDSSFGTSTNPPTTGGFTIELIRTGGGAGTIEVYVTGNAVSYLTGKNLWVNGTEYIQTGSPGFDGTGTGANWTAGGFVFVNGRQFSVEFGDAFLGPVLVGLSTSNFSTATFNISFAASNRIAGDILVIEVETENQAIAAPTGFTEFTSYTGTPSRGTAGAAGGVRMTVFTKISVGTETTVTIPDSGVHQIAAGYVLRGRAGQTVELATGAAAGNNTGTAGSFTAPTTATADNLILFNVASDRDLAAANWTGLSNPSLIEPVELIDTGTASGAGGGVALFAGGKSTAGSVSNATAPHAANLGYAWITLAARHASSGTSGTVSGSLPLTGSATGTVSTGPTTGSASGTLPLGGLATGTVRIVGLSSGSLSLTGAAVGTVRIAGLAGGSFSLTGSATGAASVRAVAAGGLPLSGSGVAIIRIAGVASGSLSFTGSATGAASTVIIGSATGILPLAGSAVASVMIGGSANGSISLMGSATAGARITANAAGILSLAGAASARSGITGSAAGFLDLTGSSDGTIAVFGEAAGDLPLTGSAAGMISTPVPLPAPRVIVPPRQQTTVTPGAIERIVEPPRQQTILTPPAQDVIVNPPRRCCVIILAGYEETNMSSEYFEWPDKLAPAVIFYGVDWARRLGEATIVSHDFEKVSGDVTLTPRSASGTETSVSIAGGTAGSVAVIIATAVASDGETHAIRVSIDIT